MLKFKPWFHESEELCSKQYDVMFTVNRYGESIESEPFNTQVLFPG